MLIQKACRCSQASAFIVIHTACNSVYQERYAATVNKLHAHKKFLIGIRCRRTELGTHAVTIVTGRKRRRIKNQSIAHVPLTAT